MLKVGMKNENGLKNIYQIYLNTHIKILNPQKLLFNIGLIQESANHNYKVIYFNFIY